VRSEGLVRKPDFVEKQDLYYSWVSDCLQQVKTKAQTHPKNHLS
jgi:hypothetical protein